MNYYQFPTIEHIDDVLSSIKDRDEFVVAERDWGTVIDYQITLPDSFPCPTEAQSIEEQRHAMLRRECRGLKFYRDGTLAARPYHKFFNLNERAETSDRELSNKGRFHENFVIMSKLDGSMVHPMLVDGAVQFCTRMGITDVAAQAMHYAEDYQSSYIQFSQEMLMRGLTPVFEWCSRKQRIVLDYPKDQLTLTAIRVNRTGEYLTRKKMQILSASYNIPMVGLYDGSWDGIEEFSANVRDIEHEEGYVLRWDDGNMVKMKSDWYVAIHRAKDSIMHEKRIIGLILNDDLGDVLSHVLPEDYNRLNRYCEDFWNRIEEAVDALESVCRINRQLPDAMGVDDRTAKGMFAKSIVSGYKEHMTPWKSLLFKVWDGADPRETIISYLRGRFSLDVPEAKSNGSQADVDELRAAYMLPETKWEDY